MNPPFEKTVIIHSNAVNVWSTLTDLKGMKQSAGEEEMELEILSVSKETLRFVKRIVVEWHLEDTKQKLITLLEKEGFRLIYEEPRDYGDLYFEK